MAEVCTPPIITEDDEEERVTFTDKHTWRDVARWIISEDGAEDVMRELADLQGETP